MPITITPLFTVWVSDSTLNTLLESLHFASPVVLVVVFLVTFTAHSIVAAPKDRTVRASTEQTGPGGKPLPQNTGAWEKKRQVLDFSPTRKLLFTWLSVGTILTFVGNAVVVIIHTLLDRKHGWWCGEDVAVSESLFDESDLLSDR